MKIKTIKAHYFEGKYILPGVVYRSPHEWGERLERLGIAKIIDKPKQKDLSNVLELEDKNAAPKKKETKRKARKANR